MSPERAPMSREEMEDLIRKEKEKLLGQGFEMKPEKPNYLPGVNPDHLRSMMVARLLAMSK